MENVTAKGVFGTPLIWNSMDVLYSSFGSSVSVTFTWYGPPTSRGTSLCVSVCENVCVFACECDCLCVCACVCVHVYACV